MSTRNLPEVWLRGPLPGILPVLQPVAHALLQSREELRGLMKDFPEDLLWEKPGGVASVGFHLQHLTGVIDRLFTYAHGNPLSQQQLAALKSEGTPDSTITCADLVSRFSLQIDEAIKRLQAIPEENLLQHRGVGRAQLPSTVLGLVFHCAEHTMRHLGQLLVTTRILTTTQSNAFTSGS